MSKNPGIFRCSIIMLTARGETVDVIKGLKYGADDYVTKPFHEPELLARIEALLRRTSPSKNLKIVFKGLEWDEESVELKYEGQIISITPKEFALIGLFLKNPHKQIVEAHGGEISVDSKVGNSTCFKIIL